MTISPRLLSVGNDPILMTSRTLLLRGAGYLVEEAFAVDKAIILVEESSIDVTVICHTIPKDEQEVLIAAVREKRRLMPIICIRSHAYETAPKTCVAVDKEPEYLLRTLKLATAPKKFST